MTMAMFPWGARLSAMSWWHSPVCSKPKTCESTGSIFRSWTSVLKRSASRSSPAWEPCSRFCLIHR